MMFQIDFSNKQYVKLYILTHECIEESFKYVKKSQHGVGL